MAVIRKCVKETQPSVGIRDGFPEKVMFKLIKEECVLVTRQTR